LFAVFALALAITPAAAQEAAPATPPLRVGFDLRAGLAPDDDGYFNITDYEHGTLRLFRLSVSAEARAGRRVAVLGELVSENMAARVRALYLRVTPLEGRAFDVQAGLLPPVFGTFARRAYGDDGPLIGFPLGYQYLTTMRTDGVPSGADDLLRVRGRGWLVPYPSGAYPPGPGVPLVSAGRWDTGVELRVGDRPLEAAVSLTRGSLCEPIVEETNDGKQLAARIAWRPRPDWTFGASGARGDYLRSSVVDNLPEDLRKGYHQSALGLDMEYARGHLLLRAEVIQSWWELPPVGTPAITDPLRGFAAYLEGRYKMAPGWTAGARVDRLRFSTLQGSSIQDTWDANVTRVEAGVAWSPRRQLSLRAVYQYNWRDTRLFSREGFIAGQIGVWF
jgi:hypothetical protein